MPFYEYQCQKCGHHLEAMQKVSDPPMRKCPDCGKSALKRLLSAPVFRLKGGGWYETDFKSDAEQKRNLAVDKDDAPAPAPAAEPAKATEAKPAVEATPAAKPKAAAKPKRPSQPRKAASKGPAKARRAATR